MTMLTIYAICAIVGGVLILMGLLGGDHGADHGDIGFGHDTDLGGDVGHETDAGHVGAWLPFLSLRFWAYSLAGFGLAGLVLTLLRTIPPVLIPWLAGGFGLLIGLVIAYILRVLSINAVNSGAGEQDLLGTLADVVVPIRGSNAGRVRACIKGDIIDLLAITDEQEALPTGSQVIIVSVEGDRVRVMSSSALLDDEVVRTTS